MIEIGADVKRSWLGRSFTKVRNRGDEGHEEEEEKWWRHEKWLGLTAGSLFNSGSNEGHTMVH
jgi:hypothetical protein